MASRILGPLLQRSVADYFDVDGTATGAMGRAEFPRGLINTMGHMGPWALLSDQSLLTDY